MSKLSFRGKILLMLATALVALLFMAVSSLLNSGHRSSSRGVSC